MLTDLLGDCRDQDGEWEQGRYALRSGEKYPDSIAMEIQSTNYDRWLECTLLDKYQRIQGKLGVNLELNADTQIDFRLICNRRQLGRWILRYAEPIDLNMSVEGCVKIRFQATRYAGLPENDYGAVLGSVKLTYAGT
ncbi:hypothetical protein [Microbispora triticiradicis]|uniref:hypothetical protein n=1 Tax=Microbispora triticiradicis TaxID=2200763 RepID=UPI001AD66473|nr:hypothetical protein [Microbispora triticiradicis]MBO4272335.1 hypothetical protein [Microbispora triticiradicis]